MAESNDESASGAWSSLVLSLLLASVTFWAQAAVTEERFVPALNVLAQQAGIAPEVAGATLMAAGAACPNLLAVIISMFVTHSELGIGCIIGSEMFQQLFCVAGAVLAHRHGNLVLSPATTLREVFFYAFSLALLLRALVSDVRSSDDDEQNESHIYISLWDGISMLLTYLLYVVFCVKFGRIMAIFCSDPKEVPTDDDKYMVMDEEDSACSIAVLASSTPFLRQVRYEPRRNFHSENEIVLGAFSYPHDAPQDPDVSFCASDIVVDELMEYDSDDIIDVSTKPRGLKKLVSFLVMSPPGANNKKPSKLHNLEDVEISEENQLSCFLWQQSVFYDRTRLVGRNAWQLRWFTFSNNGVVSVPDRVGFAHHGKLVYPAFGQVEVDNAHLVFRLHSTVVDGPKYVMMAPCKSIFDAVLERVRANIEKTSHTSDKGMAVDEISSMKLESDMIAAEKGGRVSFIDYPHGSPFPVVLAHIVLFPLKALLYYTIPDVVEAKYAHGKGILFRSILAILASALWLVVSAYVMVTSLENAGALLNIPDSVLGITVSAVGTSVPIFVSSTVAARRGLGNMAISNALGSNTFNILIGLGLPWTLYVVLCSDDGYYHDMSNEGLTDSIVLLAGSLAVFLLMVLWSRFNLTHCHAWFMIGMYIAYLAYAVGNVYWVD